jgi:hypothetical protein
MESAIARVFGKPLIAFVRSPRIIPYSQCSMQSTAACTHPLSALRSPPFKALV